MYLQGTPQVTHNGATAGSTKEIDCHGYNAVMIIHEITGGATGGFAQAELRPVKGTAGQIHPAPAAASDWGVNVKTAASLTSYVSIYRGLTSRVGIVLTVTDGTHKVTAIPCSV